MKERASKILMVRPANFGFNPQTAESNAFQKELDLDTEVIASRAADEFDRMVAGLRDINVDVEVVDQPQDHDAPDAVFPNNVFSTHPDGTLCLYPMESAKRRLERSILKDSQAWLNRKRVVDLTPFEEEEKFLEGTGSLVLDHDEKVAFACLSSRTHPEVLAVWADYLGYEPLPFSAFDSEGMRIYHTNVMMCLGSGFATVCLDSIANRDERDAVETRIKASGRDLVEISYEQMYSFAGNMIEISDSEGNPVIVMSKAAISSLEESQLKTLNKHAALAAFDIETIEACGGGSARCMIAEVF